MLSVIIPSYNECGNVSNASQVISRLLSEARIPYELIFVDDGSKDSTWREIQECSCVHSGIRGLKFSRNFGKEAAILAGLVSSRGTCCAVIDCDLQHPPEKLVEMYRLWEQGYEIIEAVKEDRGKESFFHGLGTKVFYKLICKATGFNMSNATDFKLMDRKVVNAIISMREQNAFFRALSAWVGFKSTCLSFDVHERVIGETKWSTWSLIKYALNNLSSFSSLPMQLVTFLGIIMLICSVILGCISLVQKLNGEALEGFTTVILLILFSSSTIMISLGIIGYYLSKIYEEIKGRPRYIISETCSTGEGHDACLPLSEPGSSV